MSILSELLKGNKVLKLTELLNTLITIIILSQETGAEFTEFEKRLYSSELFIILCVIAVAYSTTNYSIRNTVLIFLIWAFIRYSLSSMYKKNEKK